MNKNPKVHVYKLKNFLKVKYQNPNHNTICVNIDSLCE